GNGNQQVVHVSYTWKLADVPSWVDKKAFANVKGMNEPEDGAINLVKTSNGWKAL
ncbi:DNA-directed RNA polymerase subunit beta, partial [Klebsiella pneumoniae]|nr:DNA-directed RNA polymerase subunit beta [Klebsiella pneumoniae]ELA1751665.1 DNA-directed RNA polymerase subunit beta [Klebsiella pneumoniae]ELA1790642.1 DNA-directed RNA polymerase subunit beta [Klebsiella pneumoniae]HBQ3007407.1 DNA-directed RNA polymerase subunit beta [Klebsiella pneumoniae]HBS6775002.1 DNA-directed RNA polymerase subunit beta [Klebsiella pneumoniae]